jgi:hypothetical protein
MGLHINPLYGKEFQMQAVELGKACCLYHKIQIFLYIALKDIFLYIAFKVTKIFEKMDEQ